MKSKSVETINNGTNKRISFLYSYWVKEYVNKGFAHNYTILSYPDLVQIRTLDENNKFINYKIDLREEAMTLISKNSERFNFIEINIQELISTHLKISKNQITQNNQSSSNIFKKITRPIIAAIKRLNKIWKSIIYIILTAIAGFFAYLLIELYNYILTLI